MPCLYLAPGWGQDARAMAASGRIRRRLAAAIVVTALIPLLGAIFLAGSMVSATAARFYRPEVGARLDEAIGLFRELARVQKASMRHEFEAIAGDGALRKALLEGRRQDIDGLLGHLLREHPAVVSLDLEGPSGQSLGHADRGRPVDEEREFRLDLGRSIGVEGSPVLLGVFAADKGTFDGLESMSAFVDQYGKVVEGRQRDEQTYVLAFGVLLGVAIVLAIGVGATLARGVSRRITDLAKATKRVAGGDLGTRVSEQGSDEIADLARAFNRMLVEVQTSRARIEYLQRIGAWQDMARRLAHEIKNPLTPIQLAVEEVHQRYGGSDPRFEKLLDDTLDVVQVEVGTLRRLVGEFSDFARLPQAKLGLADLAELLAEHESMAEYEPALAQDDSIGASAPIEVVFDLAIDAAPAFLDRQMMGRVFVNLVRNAAQAIRGAGHATGHVNVSLKRGDEVWIVDVDDDGPGIAPEMRERVFDPYFTTKTEGTGLGLAIVKKIVVEHGGSIVATGGALGGARMHLEIPVAGTAASLAALEAERAEAPEAPSTVNGEIAEARS
jgi:two-component system nitrogen regulation sensor histidine kinase NtrY